MTVKVPRKPRVAASAAIEPLAQQFRQAIEASPVGMLMVDPAGRIVLLNSQIESLFGYTREELLGQPVELLVPDRLRAQHPEHRAGFLRAPSSRPMGVGRDLHGRRKDGSEVPIEIGLNPVRTSDGEFVLSSVVDITERRRSAEQFRLAIEASPTGMIMVDRNGTIVLVNAQIERIFGYAREELVGRSIENLVPERFRARHPGFRGGFFDAPDARAMGAGRDLYGLRKDGSEVPIEIGLNPLRTPEGDYVLSSVLDITERKRADHDRARFFELSVDMVCIVSPQGRFQHLNPAFSRVLGYATSELLDRPILDFVHEDDRQATRAELEGVSGARTSEFTNRYRCSDGSYRWLEWRTASETDGTIYGVARDVTRDRELLEELRHRQAALSASLGERDVLLQEVHHRVKNNLQVIMSLINMQVRQMGDSESKLALAECQHRIAVIALIHEKLYQSSDRARVPFSEYARGLADNIVYAGAGASGRVSLRAEMQDLSLAIDRAIPCGLILNELLTNAMRHGFPGEQGGTIHVTMQKRGDQRLELVVHDDGVGLPESVQLEKSTSLGMQLVSTLVAQLEGDVEIVRDRGTTVRVGFPIEAH